MSDDPKPPPPHSQGQSRLDKLFILLEAPSTSAGLRRISAKQIASIVESSPEDAPIIISKLLPLIFSASSDIRVSVAFGLELIAAAMKIESLNYAKESQSLGSFDLEQVVTNHVPLLASGGTEYDVDPGLTTKMQKQNLKNVFSIAEGVEIDGLAEDIVKEEDLTVDRPEKPMSAREKAMAKRKAKIATNVPSSKKAALGNGAGVFSLAEDEGEPLTKSVQHLIDSMLSPSWHTRHGALLGLESIFSGQGSSGGREPRETLAVQLVTLLSLDRFGDYNGDHMVAPVREAAATVLGIVAGSDLVDECAVALSALTAFPEHWQIRHGGLVGLNKLDFGNKQTAEKLIQISPSLLDDDDDDVKTLTARLLCRVVPASTAELGAVFRAAIGLLEKADDLSSSVSPVLELVRILSHRGLADERLQSLLLPYFRSPLSSIRLQTLQTVQTIGSVDEDVRRQVLQVVLLEDNEEIVRLAASILEAQPPRCAADYLPAIFTDVGREYPSGLFTFYSLGSPEPSATPPSHEVSFKQADCLVVDQNVACRQRVLAARALAGLFPDLSGHLHSALSSVLIVALQPLGKCELGRSSARDKLFHSLYTSGCIVQDAASYFATQDLDVVTDFAAELVARAIEPADLLLLPLGDYAPTANIIRVGRHMALGDAEALLAGFPDRLHLLFVLLEANARLDPTRCTDIVTAAVQDLDGNVPVVFRSLFLRFPEQAVGYLLATLLPILTTDTKDERRLAVLRCLEQLIDEPALIPFAPFLLLPCMSRMSDQCEAARATAAPLFAHLVRLVPLDMALPAGLESFQADLDRCRSFIAALADPSKNTVPLPGTVRATLRPYQETGYSWLVFLQRYGLHGALCDDMGLGKTLQTLACLAHYYEQGARKPSLIVCPSSLLGHWSHEAKLYVPSLSVAVYSGPPAERRRILDRKHDLVVVAYDVFRNDIAAFAAADYGYLVLDEGHLAKNPKTKLWQAIKAARAQHRLILTGTPIQNNVGELWALFDILLPGYLGDQRTFSERVARPIAASALPNSGSRDFSAAQRCLAGLHKQVLPFIMRRMKEDVLKDLPEKIIQDYECDLSEEQRELYNYLIGDDGEDKKDRESGKGDKDNKDRENAKGLQQMATFRKICIHPLLALEDGSVPAELRQRVLGMCRDRMDDISLSPKLELLRDLLGSCGIAAGTEEDPVASGHRMLIFAQQKRSLDIVEEYVLRKCLPSPASWLRLDGDTPALSRQAIAQRFNRDPSIPVLLATTRVGGLGLNLTGADTVVFLEHDWNPMADLQAMDRAHRLGQQRVVSVYRLICRGTIEERIMGLQGWKVRVANAIVNQQNSSIQTMETAGLLDLLGTR